MNLNTQNDVMRAARPSLWVVRDNQYYKTQYFMCVVMNHELTFIKDLKERAATWWGWGHRKCLKWRRWKVKQQRPPALTERSHCELSSKPETEREHHQSKSLCSQMLSRRRGGCFSVSWGFLLLSGSSLHTSYFEYGLTCNMLCIWT